MGSLLMCWLKVQKTQTLPHSLTIQGSGVQIFNGLAEYEGGTFVTGGNLVVGDEGLILGNMTVTGGILSGTGEIAGAFAPTDNITTTVTGRTVKPGNSPGIFVKHW